MGAGASRSGLNALPTHTATRDNEEEEPVRKTTPRDSLCVRRNSYERERSRRLVDHDFMFDTGSSSGSVIKEGDDEEPVFDGLNGKARDSFAVHRQSLERRRSSLDKDAWHAILGTEGVSRVTHPRD